MRIRGLAATLLAAAGSASAQTPFEAQVMAALNGARADPAAYAAGLARYRRFYHG